MTSETFILTRRKFILIGSVAVAAPLLIDLSNLGPKAKAAKENDIDYIYPDCNGCQVCTIFFSNCRALNNRVCWCEPAGSDRSVVKR